MTIAPPPPPILLLIFSLLLTISHLPAAASGSTTDQGSSIDWILGQSGGGNKGCKGLSMGECFDDTTNEEFEMMSTRRILATTQYISYGALQANNVPCSQRGASYYNCAPGGSANPYTRGCSAITRCHR